MLCIFKKSRLHKSTTQNEKQQPSNIFIPFEDQQLPLSTSSHNHIFLL